MVAVDGGRIVGGRAGIRDPRQPDGRSRSGPRRGPARPGQRAHASRAVVAARPRAAGGAVHRLDEAAVRDPRPAGRAACRRSRSRRFTRRSRELQRSRAPSRSATSAIRSRRSGRCARRVSTASCFTSCLGSRSATARWSMRRATCERRGGGRRRARVARAACAVFGVARAVQRDPGRGRRERRADHERAPRRVGGGGRVLANGSGPWRGMLEVVGAWRDDWRSRRAIR